MKTKILILFIILVGVIHELPLLSQEPLPDTVWSKQIDNVNVVKFSPDGQYLFASTKNHGVNQLDVKTGNIIRTIMLGNNNISFSPTGDTVVLSAGNQISFININTGEIIDTLHFLTKGGTDGSAIITPDGKRIITTTGKIGFDEPQILVIDIATKEIIKTFIGRYYNAENLQFSHDGKYFCFSGCRDIWNSINLLDMNTYEEISVLGSHPAGVGDIKFSRDDKKIASCGDDGLVHIWDLETKEIIRTISVQGTEYRYINRLAFSNDSKYILLASDNSEAFYKYDFIHVYNIESGKRIYLYAFTGNGCLDVSINDYIASFGINPLDYEFYLYLLIPKWNGTDVKESLADELEYSYYNGTLQINFNEVLFEKPVINIYNILGVAVGARHAVPLQNGNEIEIDLEYLTPGVYFVVVDFNGSRKVLKILKDK
ncbi:MAG: T9SS type A sorting domain-containing protein [bacterium]